ELESTIQGLITGIDVRLLLSDIEVCQTIKKGTLKSSTILSALLAGSLLNLGVVVQSSRLVVCNLILTNVLTLSSTSNSSSLIPGRKLITYSRILNTKSR